MPLQYNIPLNGGTEAARSFLTSFPVDLYDQIITNGPLPVIVFTHGGNQFAFDFMFNTFRISQWWTTGFAFPSKAVAVGLQGVSLDSAGGDWNAGNMGIVSRIPAVQDVQFAWDALDRLERWLLDHYRRNVQPVTGGPDITQIFDRTRLLLVGFSEGGQMAYRLAHDAPSAGWKCTALAVFGTTVGGWYRQADMAGLPNVDWTPTGNPPSLFHVHGKADTAVNDFTDGPSGDVTAGIGLQVPVAQVPLYARADISGLNSTIRYNNAAAAAGFTTVAGGVQPSSIPAAVVAASTINVQNRATSGAGPADYQICCVRVNGMGHIVPTWAPEAVAQFFQLWGGL